MKRPLRGEVSHQSPVWGGGAGSCKVPKSMMGHKVTQDEGPNSKVCRNKDFFTFSVDMHKSSIRIEIIYLKI